MQFRSVVFDESRAKITQRLKVGNEETEEECRGAYRAEVCGPKADNLGPLGRNTCESGTVIVIARRFHV